MNVMNTIHVQYHSDSDTFLADDGQGNQIIFKSDREAHEAAPISSGKALGPMVSMLMSCGACSGIDIVMILEKQRQDFDQLKITVQGERAKDKVPALWEKIHVVYHLTGNLDEYKAERAAELSINKYCSVLETLRRAGAQVSYQVLIN